MYNVQLFDSNGQLRMTREFQTGSEACCYGENWIMLRVGNAFEVDGVLEEGPMRVEAFGQGYATTPRHDRVESTLMGGNPKADIAGELDIEKYSMYEKTPWGKGVSRSLEVRTEIDDLINHRKPKTKFLAKRMVEALREGIDGAWRYIGESDRVLSHVEKPIYSVAASCISCRPSKACAKFCYAYRGRASMYSVIALAELVDYLAEKDPKRLGRLIAEKFKKYKTGKRKIQAGTGGTVEYDLQALRFFDRGEGASYWADVINEVNNQGVRTHIFSKRPEFLSRIDPWNVRILSVDRTNFDITRGNDLPVGFNYTNADEIQMIESLGDRIQLILPVRFKNKEKQAAMAGHIRALEAVGGGKYKPRMCPVDSMKMELGEWHCGMCDVGRGTGCYYLQPTAEAKRDAVAA